MSVDVKPCPMCVRRDHPEISNSELRTMGATTDRTCPEHRVAVEALTRALNDAYRNTRGGFA